MTLMFYSDHEFGPATSATTRLETLRSEKVKKVSQTTTALSTMTESTTIANSTKTTTPINSTGKVA